MLTGLALQHFVTPREELLQRAYDLFELLRSGTLTLRIAATFGLGGHC